MRFLPSSRRKTISRARSAREKWGVAKVSIQRFPLLFVVGDDRGRFVLIGTVIAAGEAGNDELAWGL
jgi:3-polyprenyl-4-hydroxybenzoate decarboxylase